jgi:hypothetical protein
MEFFQKYLWFTKENDDIGTIGEFLLTDDSGFKSIGFEAA